MAKKTTKSKKRKSAKKRLSVFKRAGQFLQALRLRFSRVLKWLLILSVIVCLAPFLLTLIYKIEAIKPASTLMLSRQLSLQPMTRQWVDLDDITPALYQSVLMSEDGQFCAHNGVDWNAINIVITDALEGERPRGASTITMQTAKNLFLWGGRSYIRKALEVPLAMWIDLVLSKKRIMEIYLNIAEWDDNGVFGIQAGAKSQFNRTASKLSRRQSALMAVTLPNPILRQPSKPSAGLNKLARIIEKRAKQSGAYIKCLK